MLEFALSIAGSLAPSARGLAAIALTILIAVALIGLGLVLLGPRRADADSDDILDLPYALTAGWGALASVSAAAGLARAGQAVPVLTTLGAGLVLLAAACRRPGAPRRMLAGFGAASLLIAPALLAAAATPAVMPDDFSHWLPNARHLFVHGALPTAETPNLLTGKPGYPYAGPLLVYAAALLGGDWWETPSRIFTALLAGSFAILPATLLARRLGWPMAACLPVGLLICLAVNPTFDPRIVFTGYMDAPAAIAAALTAYALWRAVVLSAEGQTAAAEQWAWRAGLAGLAMIFIRETNLAMLAGLFAGALCAVLQQRPAALSLKAGARMAALAAGPAVVAAAAWRLYLWRENMPASGLPPRPFELWDWGAPATLARTLFLDRLANNPIMGGVALLALAGLAYGLHSVRRAERRDAQALYVIVGVTAATYGVFLLFAHIAVLQPHEVASAAQVWRYGGHLGFIILTAIIVAALPARPASPPAPSGRKQAALGLAATVAALAIFTALTPRMRIDWRYVDATTLRAALPVLAPPLAASRRIVLIHPQESDWYAFLVAYALNRPRGDIVVFERIPSPQELSGEGLGAGDVVFDLTGFDRANILAAATVPLLSVVDLESAKPLAQTPARPLGDPRRVFPEARASAR